MFPRSTSYFLRADIMSCNCKILLLLLMAFNLSVQLPQNIHHPPTENDEALQLWPDGIVPYEISPQFGSVFIPITHQDFITDSPHINLQIKSIGMS